MPTVRWSTLAFCLCIGTLTSYANKNNVIYNNSTIVSSEAIYRSRELQSGSSNIFLRAVNSVSSLTTPSYYYVTNSDPALLPRNNYDVTIGNPMRGLHPSPDNISFKDWTPMLPASIGDFKWPLNRFMLNDPDFVGEDLAFDWNFVESKLREVANHNVHAVIRFYVHWPGQPFYVPAYLYDPPYNFTLINTTKNEKEIDYDDPVLKNAFRQCITALANRYDGDKRLLTIQAGLAGYWGEWHTLDSKFNKTTPDCQLNATSPACKFNVTPCLPRSVNNEIISYLQAAFRTTHIQVRYPEYTNAYKAGFGYFDDSFTYYTLNGTYNGGVNREAAWFFWNLVIINNVSDFWKTTLMGGEVRPENDDVFADSYPAGTEHHQEFNACTENTHATYMGFSRGWHANSYKGINGTELTRARYATSRMGYSYEIDTVAVAATPTIQNSINIDVTLRQTGVAPFYYPLNLTLYCVVSGTTIATQPIQTRTLAERYSTLVISFQSISVTSACLNAIDFKLESSYLYPGRPIKWAQGQTGSVVLSIPPIPTLSPTGIPTTTPTKIPTTTSTQSPVTASPLKPSTNSPISLTTRSDTLQPVQPTTPIPTAKPWTPSTRVPTLTPLNPSTRTPTGTPVTPVTQIPTATPVTQIPTATPVTRIPAATPVTRIPTATPVTRIPTATPMRTPTRIPTATPVRTPTRIPTATPVRAPTRIPTGTPVRTPTRIPTATPVRAPTRIPTATPVRAPTRIPTATPVRAPTRIPTATPVRAPTRIPTAIPVRAPTRIPTATPVRRPTRIPTATPVRAPTRIPTATPVRAPTRIPTVTPVRAPTRIPTATPVRAPTRIPTATPVRPPTRIPTTSQVTTTTQKPTGAPRAPTRRPTGKPTGAPRAPTRKPTRAPRNVPTRKPTRAPRNSPTRKPTAAPRNVPTRKPTKAPKNPTRAPTKAPVTPPTWVANWYFVNVNTSSVLYNSGKIVNGQSYSFASLGRFLSLVVETNTSIVKLKFTWPVTNYTLENGVPFALQGNNGTKYVRANYLINTGFKSIRIQAYRTNNVLAFTQQMNFTMT